MQNASISSQARQYLDALIPLPYTFISITGVDAEKFLQGQVSCDLRTLDEQSASYSTVNTAKGRIYGLFKIVRSSEGFLLRMESSCVSAFMAQLSKYSAFFKAKIQIADQFRAFGLLSDMHEAPKQANTLLRYSDGFILRCPSETPMFEFWSDSNLSGVASSSPEPWFVQETLNGIPELYAETQEQFILQQLNLQHLGAVSFNKGCYTGQEIIARMKFLGKLKKKAYLLQTPEKREQEKNTALAGSDILDQTGKKCGELIRCHWSQRNGTVALGVLNISDAEHTKQLSLANTEASPFQIREPVYNL